MTLTIHTEPPTARELWLAYRAARLHRTGISLLKALESPLIYKSLCLQARVMRKTVAQQTK